MSRLRLEYSTQQAIVSFSRGNPGAISFLLELVKAKPKEFVVDFITIDNMKLYEDKLYMLWNDSCNRDIDKVLKIFNQYRLGKITQQDIEDRVKTVSYGKSFDDLLEEE